MIKVNGRWGVQVLLDWFNTYVDPDNYGVTAKVYGRGQLGRLQDDKKHSGDYTQVNLHDEVPGTFLALFIYHQLIIQRTFMCLAPLIEICIFTIR